jgi:hypothetical protein
MCKEELTGSFFLWPMPFSVELLSIYNETHLKECIPLIICFYRCIYQVLVIHLKMEIAAMYIFGCCVQLFLEKRA